MQLCLQSLSLVHCVGPGIFVIIEIATQEVIRNKDVLMNEWRHYHEED